VNIIKLRVPGSRGSVSNRAIALRLVGGEHERVVTRRSEEGRIFTLVLGLPTVPNATILLVATRTLSVVKLRAVGLTWERCGVVARGGLVVTRRTPVRESLALQAVPLECRRIKLLVDIVRRRNCVGWASLQAVRDSGQAASIGEALLVFTTAASRANDAVGAGRAIRVDVPTQAIQRQLRSV
jgi:hypothetical protein